MLTRRPPTLPPRQDGSLTFTLVAGGIGAAVAQTKAAARKRAVQVIGGVGVARQLLRAGLGDGVTHGGIRLERTGVQQLATWPRSASGSPPGSGASGC